MIGSRREWRDGRESQMGGFERDLQEDFVCGNGGWVHEKSTTSTVLSASAGRADYNKNKGGQSDQRYFLFIQTTYTYHLFFVSNCS